MKPLCPRHKRLKREGRLQAAKHWLQKYDGKNIVKGYSKHFGVDMICAVLELRMLGYEISEYYFEQLKYEEVQRQQLKERKKRMKEQQEQVDMLEFQMKAFILLPGTPQIEESDEAICGDMEHDTNEIPFP